MIYPGFSGILDVDQNVALIDVALAQTEYFPKCATNVRFVKSIDSAIFTKLKHETRRKICDFL